MSNKQPVYIMSLEAEEIYSHMHRNFDIDAEYLGMIPYSLEIIKLKSLKGKFNTRTLKHNQKEISSDIINVKFQRNVKSSQRIMKGLPDKIKTNETKLKKLKKEVALLKGKKKKSKQIKVDSTQNYLTKLKKLKKNIEENGSSEHWKEIKYHELRKLLYAEGFILTDEDGYKTEYVAYKRSSSKSRKGECLFIKKALHDEMINWSRMDLKFHKDEEMDLASLLAYESLVGSALEDTMTIDPNKILVVDDVESKFKRKCNVIRKNDKTGFLDSFTEENFEIVNSLFDGQSLLESSYFEDGVSMKLLRNHMFKSAAFNTNIQLFLRDNCPKDITFEEWELTDMFGNSIYAKDVHMITTPSSLKCLKFSHVFGSGIPAKKAMFDHWKKVVKEDNNLFGICKHEKESKRGKDEEGNILQQTSYQMLNSLPLKKEDIFELTKYEREVYINKLKSDDDFFIKFLKETANVQNANQMFVDLCERNKDFINTEIFRDFRKGEINAHVNHVKLGKIRLIGDYCTMIGNPVEFLYHAIGQFDIETVKEEELPLRENEIHTNLFEDGKVLTGFRNPHTSPSNVIVCVNKKVAEIDKYFNLTDNIVCVNAINFEIQDILSGADYDSDTLALFDHEVALVAAKKSFRKYHVCINKVESKPNRYKPTKENMFEIDNTLFESSKYIGQTVNTAQLCMSRYWDLMKSNDKGEAVKLLKKIDVATVLSTICIDLAKKLYDIDVKSELEHIDESFSLKTVEEDKKIKSKKPKFWKNISGAKTIKSRVTEYDCPMDYLEKVMSNLKYAKHHKNVEFTDLLVEYKLSDGNRPQEEMIINTVQEMSSRIEGVFAERMGKKERNNAITGAIDYANYRIRKLKVSKETIHAILVHMVQNKSSIAIRLMTVLHRNKRDIFLGAFKQS